MSGKKEDGVWMEWDDMEQQQILPLASLPWCEAEIRKGEAFAAEHAIVVSPDPTVYPDIYRREASPTPLSSLRIGRDELEDIMESCSFHRTHVVGLDVPDQVAAYRKELEEHKWEEILFFGWDENDTIDTIWLGGPLGPENVGAMSALRELGRRYPLLYVDWGWKLIAVLDQGPGLDHVAAVLEDVRRRNAERGQDS